MINFPPVGPNLATWANDLRRFLSKQWSQLDYKRSGASATEDGIFLWDAAGYPVVSKSGEWRQIVLADGYAFLGQDTDITAASPDTAYAISWDAPSMADGVSLVSGSRITFAEGGVYYVSFSAQVTSSSASSIAFYFWPAVNGVDVPGSTIQYTLHQNGATNVVSRSAIFSLSAGDYLEAMWAVSDTNGSLTANAATAFSPATPAATISMTRIRQ